MSQQIAISVDSRTARRRIQDVIEALGRTAKILSHRLPGSELLAHDHEILVIDADRLPAAEEEIASIFASNSCGVIVLLRERDGRERARFLTLGAASVLSLDLAHDKFATLLQHAIEGREERGRIGPDDARVGTNPSLADFASRNPRMQGFLELVQKVAPTDTTLLISGETGVGKEHLARAIHADSKRGRGPFVSVNCGALPENLLESELFGHEAGAFTGAAKERKGRFEQAVGGTIFLDEIGEMSPPLQVKLLTVLQRKEVRPLGSDRVITIDVRIIAATNRDLSEEVATGTFREDLYYRLNVLPLCIPPLRDRREDIPDLVGSFLHHFRQELDREGLVGISDEALEVLTAHDWPGNIREMLNTMERVTLLAEGQHVTLEDLPESCRSGAPRPARREGRPAPPTLDLPEDWREQPLTTLRSRLLEQLEKRYLTEVLRLTRGRIGETAARAGLSTRTIYDKMRHHGIRKEEFRCAPSRLAKNHPE